MKSDFDKSLEEIIENLVSGEAHDEFHYTGDGNDCSKEIEPDEAISQIKQLIKDEVIGERKSVAELENTFPESLKDLVSKICFKDGYNTKILEQRDKLA